MNVHVGGVPGEKTPLSWVSRAPYRRSARQPVLTCALHRFPAPSIVAEVAVFCELSSGMDSRADRMPCVRIVTNHTPKGSP